MAEKKKTRRVKGTVRNESDRRLLSLLCDWWDRDEQVSLVAFAIKDDEGPGDGATARSVILTSPHHGIEIVYRVAKVIKCDCDDPGCHITKSAEAVIAVIELQVEEARSGKAAQRH